MKNLFYALTILSLSLLAQACKDKDAQIKEPCDKQCGFICKNDTCHCPPGYYQVPKTVNQQSVTTNCLKDTGQILKANLAGTPISCFKSAHINGVSRIQNIRNATINTGVMGIIEWNQNVSDSIERGFPNNVYLLGVRNYTRGEEYDVFETFEYEFYRSPNRLCYSENKEFNKAKAKDKYYHRENILDIEFIRCKITYLASGGARLDYLDIFNLKFAP